MSRINIIYLMLMVLSLFITLVSVNVFAASGKNKTNKYTFAVFPYISAKQLGNSYGPVAAEFSKILGTQVNFTSTPNYEDFTAGLAEGRFDIAVVQPFDYTRAVDNYGYRPLARVDADLMAHFVVKTDSKYQSLADLKDTRVALPSTTAALSRLAKKELTKHGYTIGQDITVKNFKKFGSCLQDVIIGQSSSCASGLAIKKLYEARMNVKFRTIYVTPPIPHISLVIHKRVAEKDRELLKNAIVNWKNTAAGKKIIKGTRLPGFRETDDSDYDVIRNFDD